MATAIARRGVSRSWWVKCAVCLIAQKIILELIILQTFTSPPLVSDDGRRARIVTSKKSPLHCIIVFPCYIPEKVIISLPFLLCLGATVIGKKFMLALEKSRARKQLPLFI